MPQKRLKIAIVGTGISGMSTAWLLAKHHDVTVYEKNDRIGGHTNTASVALDDGTVDVDTGFIVYNERNYPNLTRLFSHLGVHTTASDMSFAASMGEGRFEYSGSGLRGLFSQPQNLVRPRMWSMLRDIRRFYREAPLFRESGLANTSLGDYLEENRYGRAFIHDHLLPMGAAIWSTPTTDMLDYPLTAFVRFCSNHGLLQVRDRPQWRTVTGGSRRYIEKLTSGFSDRILLNSGVVGIRRTPENVLVEDRQGNTRHYDHVVLASHANETLSMLADADKAEKQLLGAFSYEKNLAILHTDNSFMPKARRAWSSWNYLDTDSVETGKVALTYWMNRLQPLNTRQNLFVTLNPHRPPADSSILRSFLYEHPVFTRDAIRAQPLLWNLQGTRRTWYCGAYFGHGFHEDGLEAGLAVGEQLGGTNRPWETGVPGRIYCHRDLAGARRRREAA